jgi:hypothetical protein
MYEYNDSMLRAECSDFLIQYFTLLAGEDTLLPRAE